MSSKNSHYKLDFKIVRSKEEGGNLTLRDFRRRYYWTGTQRWNVPFIENFVWRLTENKKLETIAPADIDVAQAASDAGVVLNMEEVKDFHRFIKLGRNAWCADLQDETGRLKNKFITYKAEERYNTILAYLATKTPEFQKCEAEFEKWIEKRPGMKEVWEEVYEEDKITLLDFARAASSSEFRTRLENARPRVLKIGTLVQLKDKFVNTRSKDPFYWDDEHKGSPRLGMIAGFNESSAYGYGSRLLRIMWIANSAESTLMERELKILSE